MRYYHDVVTYRDLKNPGLRVRLGRNHRIYVAKGRARAYLDASVAREAWSTREGFRILLLYITLRHTPAIMYHPIS